MAWIFLAGSEEAPLLWHPGCGPSPIAKASSLRKTTYLRCNKKERSRLRLSATTYEPSEEDMSASLWTSFTAAGPARTSVQRELEKAWKASDPGLSLKSYDSFANSSPDGSFWRIPQGSLFPALGGFSWSSMRWGMMRDGQLFQPKRWVPRMSGNGSGFLPTPTASPYGSNRNASPGSVIRPSLQTLVRTRFPTPRASDGPHGGPTANDHGVLKLPGLAVRIATPCARDGKDGWTPKQHGRKSPSVAVAVAAAGHCGYLNPSLVEVIMGYPIGWTDYTDWGTHGCLKSREKPSCDSRGLRE
jgi:hypothetical protein